MLSKTACPEYMGISRFAGKSKILFLLIITFMTMFFYSLAFSRNIEKEYNLDELVKIAFQNNPQLKANDKNIQAGMKQIDYLDKDYLPQIFFDLNLSRWDWVMPNKQKYLGNSFNDFYSDFRINQLIYDWNRNSIQKDYADKSVDVDRSAGRKLRQILINCGLKDYSMKL
jgi:outer membrane protein TolC